MLLFPSQPFDPKTVDHEYSGEFKAAQALGLDAVLIDSDRLDLGEYEEAVRRVPVQQAESSAVYRGWMLSPTAYRSLHDALAARRVHLINSPERYRHAHFLPESYSRIADCTPRSVWTTDGNVLDRASLATLLAPLGGGPIIVKDYVKSQKHYWSEACFIPSAADLGTVERVARRFAELQGESFCGGYVFREFIEFAPLGVHPSSGMPLTREYRLFVLDGEIISVNPYWGRSDPADSALPLDELARVAARVDSRFFTMDVALTIEGRWLVVELGDGQVAGLPAGLPPSTLFARMKSSLGWRSLTA